MKLKTIILMSGTTIGATLIIPTTIRGNNYNHNSHQTQLGNVNKTSLSEVLKITKPTAWNPSVKFTGLDGSGTYQKPEYKNTTVQLFNKNGKPINKPLTGLSNWPFGIDGMSIGYTPNKGYTWTDGTNKMVKIYYVVKNLPTTGIVIKPTSSTAPVKFTGMDSSGTYQKPEYKNTIVQLFDINNTPINKPLTNLSNGDHMYIGYTPNKGYTWSNGTNDMVKIEYVVSGLITGIAKPTASTAPVKFTGLNYSGTYKAPKYANTTVKLFNFDDRPINKPLTGLSNYPYGTDEMYVGYTPNKGYVWKDGTNKMVQVMYYVEGLPVGLTKPTASTAPVKFTGLNGSSTYQKPQYANTTVNLFDSNNNPIDKPLTNLSNGDHMYVGYTPDNGYVWNDNTNKMVKIEYVVSGLITGIAEPTASTVPVKFTGVNGHGTYKAPKYANTTVQLYNWELQAIDKPVTNLHNSPYYACYMFVGFTPNKGYAWNNGNKNMIKVRYSVTGLSVGLTKPTISSVPVKFTGLNGSSTYQKPQYANTTAQLFDSNNNPIDNPLTNLSNGNYMYVGYTPNKGYAWNDDTNKMVKIKYVVSGLCIGLTKPTASTAPVKFTGVNYSGTYKAPKYANTTVKLFNFDDRPINKPLTGLSNYPYGTDEMYIGYTPNKGYTWNDGTNKMVKIEYYVEGLPTALTKPTASTAPVKFTGVNYGGTYKAPKYANTTVQLFNFDDRPINKPLTGLSNWPYGTDEMYIGYTPNKGYTWNDGTNKMVKIEYYVEGLPTALTKPTASTAPVKFSGINGSGTYQKPQYTNTTVQLFDSNNNPIDKPLTNLSNGDHMYVSYTPNKGYAWKDGTNKMVKIEYYVEGLPTALTKPTASTAPVKFSGINGSGTYQKPQYTNTTVQLFDSNNNPIDKPLTNLSNGDHIYVSYTPNKGYAWKDGTNKMVKIEYVVSGLSNKAKCNQIITKAKQELNKHTGSQMKIFAIMGETQLKRKFIKRIDTFLTNKSVNLKVVNVKHVSGQTFTITASINYGIGTTQFVTFTNVVWSF